MCVPLTKRAKRVLQNTERRHLLVFESTFVELHVIIGRYFYFIWVGSYEGFSLKIVFDSATNFGRDKMSQVMRFWRVVWQDGITLEMVYDFRFNNYVKIISLGVVADTIFELLVQHHGNTEQ